MPAGTAPNEFGHFIGLSDEHQRTQDDFEEITGTEIIGPENTFGKTNEEISIGLNSALTGADEATRAADATFVLAGVGLFVAGLPQQGHFVRAVMDEYDDAYKPSLLDDLIALPPALADGCFSPCSRSPAARRWREGWYVSAWTRSEQTSQWPGPWPLP